MSTDPSPKHQPSRWNASQLALHARIEAHPIGGDDADAFARRLAREQGWDTAQTADAIIEYRRFCFLAMVTGHEVTPSEEVDAVWHLHLLHTRDYWTRFCPQVLCGTLHHGPTRGAADAAHFRECYAQTLAAYESYFGPPSSTWWPGSSRRFAPRARMRAFDPARHWLLPRPRLPRTLASRLTLLTGSALAAAPAQAAATRPANPLDWGGGDFLMLFLAAMVLALVVSLALRAWLRRQLAPPARSMGELSVWEAAWLAGGAPRVVDAGVAELHRLGAVEVDATGNLRATDRQQGVEPPLDAILANVSAGRRIDATMRAAAARLRNIQTTLERRGLWFAADVAHRISLIGTLPWVALLLFGGAKVAIGISRDRPVLILVVLCLASAAIALGMYFSRATRTAAGDAELKRLNDRHATTRRAPRSEQVSLAVALAGTSVLAGTALASYHTARHPPSSTDSSSGSDSGSSDSSDSGGSSGCGGCGGGGD